MSSMGSLPALLVLHHERRDDLDDVFLLAARQAECQFSFKSDPFFSSRIDPPARSKKSDRLGHCREYSLGRAE